MKRILLFVLTNIAVLLILTAIIKIFGLDRWLVQSGVNMNLWGLLIFAAVIGMGGSFISLALSKTMAIHGMGVQVIEQPQGSTERWLKQVVEQQARQAGIGMPDVGIFDSPEPNAFATGMSRDSALVAVSTGLLDNMSQNEVEAVLGHEVSHVANGDMVTMTLLQGILNTFVYFLAYIIGNLVDRVILKNENGRGAGYYLVTIVAQVVLGILASIIVMWFSRYREFHADSGGAKLAGRQNMIAALQALQRQHEPEDLPGQLAAFGISGGIGEGLKKLFMSHPPLEERIAALMQARY